MSAQTPSDLQLQAVDDAYIWAVAVETQAQRVLSSHGPDAMLQRQVDAYLLVLALRNVRRAGDLALVGLDDATAQWTHTRGAIEAFEAAVPGWKTARDALEHFDDYRQGLGDTQQPRIKRGQRRPDPRLARQFTTFTSDNGDDCVIYINGVDISINAAREAAMAMVYDLDFARRI